MVWGRVIDAQSREHLRQLQPLSLVWRAAAAFSAAVTGCILHKCLTQPERSQLHAGEYVRFQPRAAGFQDAVKNDVRGVLEAALGRHSTLTQGNWIRVPLAGQEYELLVQKTRPGKAVSVIGRRRGFKFPSESSICTIDLPLS